MQRQAMSISVNELRKKADELEKELSEMEPWIVDVGNQKALLAIANKTEESDTWYFE